MNLRKFLSSGLNETCIYMLSLSALMGYFRPRKRQITASRLLSQSGPDKSKSFSQTPLFQAFWVRHSMPRQYPSCWGREFLRLEIFECFSWSNRLWLCPGTLQACRGRWQGGFSLSWIVERQQNSCWEDRCSVFSEKYNLILSFREGDSLPKGLNGVFFVFRESYLRTGSISFHCPGWH